MINYLLVLFGETQEICENLTIVLGDNIVRMLEGDKSVLSTLNSGEDIDTLKGKIKEIGDFSFILIPKEHFKSIALNMDDESFKYLFSVKSQKKSVVPKEETLVLDLNTILDKINKGGIGSLKKEEKDFLNSYK